ncbi:unnamed protein product [Urochloa decumbens]|uniref:Protein FAR1-RELATED SEQUENCE n=1 Tax=Urochloa decumbens TaxID=240449 RepID=A0ABC9C3J1_9POAL
MTSTQRSESANHMIKTIIQKAAPMHKFVCKFNEFQAGRKSEECTQNFATLQVSRRLSTRVPIEGHANEIYTKRMYEHFSNQLYESGSFIVKEREGSTKFTLIDSRLEGTDIERMIHVCVEGEDWIQCDCGLYEHMGMLCRHAIKVLTLLDRRKIPSKNILQRWTKFFDNGNKNKEYQMMVAKENEQLRRKAIVSKAFELATTEARISNFTYEEAMYALTRASTSSTKENEEDESPAVLTGELPTSCPPSTYKGGRPRSTGHRSWLDNIEKDKKEKNGKAEKEARDWPREENPATKKKRSIREIF